MPIVSIVVPVYNMERYLEKCLDSLIGQTFRDIEIIAVDDGSTDGSPKILERYAENNQAIFRFVKQQNAGAAAARNAGLELAKGKFVIFVDSDDWVDPEFIEAMLRKAREEDVDVVVCEFFVARERPGGFDISNPYSINKHLRALWRSVESSSLEENPNWLLVHPGYSWNKLCSLRLFQETGIRFPLNLRLEDLATLPRVLARAVRIAALRKPLYYYRIRQDSENRTSGRFWEDRCSVLGGLKREFNEKYFEQLTVLACRSVAIKATVRAILSGAKNSDLFRITSFMDQEFPGWYKSDLNSKHLSIQNRIILKLVKWHAFLILRMILWIKRR